MKHLLFLLLLLPLEATAEHTCLDLFTDSISEFLIFQGVEFRQRDGVYLIKPSEKTALNRLALAEKEAFHRSLVIWDEPDSKTTFLPHVLVLSWENVVTPLVRLEREGFNQEMHNLIRLSAYQTREKKVEDDGGGEEALKAP